MKFLKSHLLEKVPMKIDTKKLETELTRLGLEVDSVKKFKNKADFVLDLDLTPNRGDCFSVLGIARELAAHGIRVNTIAPGLFGTPMLTGMPDEVQKSLIATTLFPKRLGTSHEYALLVESIVTNVMLNGETIRLDGSVRLAPK